MSFDLAGKWHCPHGMCEGSAWVMGPDGKGVIHCACWPDMIKALAVSSEARIPPKYQGKRFDNGSVTVRERYPNYQNVVDFAYKYATNWQGAPDAGGWTRARNGGRCLILLGVDSGAGKTHLACAIMQQLIEDYWTESVCHQDVCCFVQPVEWFGKISEHYLRYPVLPRGQAQDEQNTDPGCKASRRSLADYEKRLETTDLLVIDDLTRFRGGDDKKLSHIFEVVNNRTNNRKPVIVTDNEPTVERVAKALGDNYGHPIMSRLEGNGDIVTIDNPRENRGKRRSQ